jgi:hypothetical protein
MVPATENKSKMFTREMVELLKQQEEFLGICGDVACVPLVVLQAASWVELYICFFLLT